MTFDEFFGFCIIASPVIFGCVLIYFGIVRPEKKKKNR